jgi:hypothetical protein
MRVTSRTAPRAKELAAVEFERFKHVVAYMLGMRKSAYHVAVLNPRQRMVAQSLVFAGEQLSLESQHLVGPLQDVNLADDYFRRENALPIWTTRKP